MAKDYKNFAIELAMQAGKIIKTNFSLGMKKEWKADNTPLTETDLAINNLVLTSVKKEYPGYSILAEEESDFSETSEFVWVCDPVDGTIPFSHGVPTCVFSLALVQNGKSILGVVYDPFMDRMFFAEKGKGATMNDGKISVSSNSDIKNSLFGVCAWWEAQFNVIPLVEAMDKEHAKIMNCVSITYMGALVANGEFAGTVFPGSKSHDTAALKVIVEEAGGKVTDFFGNEPRFDRDNKGYVVSNGVLHEKLLMLIRENVKL